jgi:hypothetical protein
MTTRSPDPNSLDRESLPPEFTAPGVEVVVALTGTANGYRSRVSGQGMLDPDELPVRRIIQTFDSENNNTSMWTEFLPHDIKFNGSSTWVDLGVGVRPDKPGLRKFLYHIALGYLSGYPISDILYFAVNFGLLPKRGERIIKREAIKEELGATPLTYTERARLVNPHYDERDT